jgi:AraC-like DNA-binding protein
MSLGKILLDRHPLARISDLSEAQHFYSRLNTPVKLEKTARRMPFRWHVNRLCMGPIALSFSSYHSGVHAAADSVEDIFGISLPLSSACGETIYGKEAVPLVHGRTGSIASPGARCDVWLDSGYQAIQVVIPGPTIRTALSALTGTNVRAPLQFDPRISLHSGRGASFWRLVCFLVNEIDQNEGVLTSPLVTARFTDALLYSLLQSQPHNYTKSLQAPPRAEPQHVRQVAEYLAAHAAEPISLATLVALVGVSVRSIHAGFQKYRGCSPMEFLRERRLMLARRRMLSSPDITVAQIALSCGFEHLGRFSILYRARFGESPVQTLRRARG